MKMDLYARSEEMKNFFDEKADGYDEVHAKFSDTKKWLTDVLMEKYPERKSLKILDLGAGTGMELVFLYDAFPEAVTTVADISENMLNHCKERPFADKLILCPGDFFKTEWGSNYDAVISTSSLHHFDEESKLVLYRKIFDTLKQNGIFINCDKTAENLESQNFLLNEYLNEPGKYRHMDTPLCIERECDILKLAGFSKIQATQTVIENYVLFTAEKDI